jgi:hypothetical protein
MTGLHLLKRHFQKRASARLPRYLATTGYGSAPEPMDLCAGLILIGLGLVLAVGFILVYISADPGDAILLLFFSSGLLILGSISLLLSLWQRLASRLKRIEKHCGCCRFYQVQSGPYVIGFCQADPSRRAVFRSESCSAFCFSERALVRERLAQHPVLLRRIQVPRTERTIS